MKPDKVNRLLHSNTPEALSNLKHDHATKHGVRCSHELGHIISYEIGLKYFNTCLVE